MGAYPVHVTAPVHPSLLRNHPAIGYATTPVTDDVSRLNGRIRSGEVSLEFNDTNGYLPSVLNALYARLGEILSGAERDARYASLSATDRQAILEILRDTKPGLPAFL